MTNDDIQESIRLAREAAANAQSRQQEERDRKARADAQAAKKLAKKVRKANEAARKRYRPAPKWWDSLTFGSTANTRYPALMLFRNLWVLLVWLFQIALIVAIVGSAVVACVGDNMIYPACIAIAASMLVCAFWSAVCMAIAESTKLFLDIAEDINVMSKK